MKACNRVIAAAALVLAVLLPAARARGGVVWATGGRMEGAVAVREGSIGVGDASARWDDVFMAVNDCPAAAGDCPEAVRLRNGEVWAGNVLQVADGKLAFKSARLGQREIPVADVLSVDFEAGLGAAGGEAVATLIRRVGGPVPATLLSVREDRVVVEMALGTVTLKRADLKRFEFGGATSAQGGTDDEVLLADGSVLRGKLVTAADGLRLTHPVLGELAIPSGSWRCLRRRPPAVGYLADAVPLKAETFALIRMPAPSPTVESGGGQGTFVSRVHMHPRTILSWTLPGDAQARASVRATLSLGAGSRGGARVRVSAGDKALYDQKLSAENPAQSVLSADAAGGSELKIEADFDEVIRFPCTVMVDDMHAVKKQ